MDHPVHVVLERPKRLARIHLLLRLGILLCLAAVGIPLGYLYVVLYVGLPVVAAVLISQHGGAAYLSVFGPRIVRAMSVWNRILAYLLFLTDRFPVPNEPGVVQLHAVEFEVMLGGSPKIGSALLRWVTSLPDLVLLVLLWVVSSVVVPIAAISVLLVERLPEFARRYLCFVLTFQARFLACHASLVEMHALGAHHRESRAVGV